MALSAILHVDQFRVGIIRQGLGVGDDVIGFDQAVLDLLGQLRHCILAGFLLYVACQRAQIFFDARFIAFGGFQLAEQLQAARREFAHLRVLGVTDDFPALHGVAIVAADVIDER